MQNLLARVAGFWFNPVFAAMSAKENGCLAQLVERPPYKQTAGGSTQSPPTIVFVRRGSSVG